MLHPHVYKCSSPFSLGTLGHREQGRIAKAFAEPGFADGLDGDVDSFVSRCFDDEGAGSRGVFSINTWSTKPGVI